MGYLANKKHENRVNVFLKAFVILGFLITLPAFFDNSFSAFLNEFRWQLFLISGVVFLYALAKKHYREAFFLSFVIIINYLSVSSVMSFFLSSPAAAQTKILFASQSSDPLEVFEQAVNKNADIIAVTHPDMNDFDIKTMIPSGYSFHYPAEGWENGFMLSKREVVSFGRIELLSAIFADFIKISEGNEKVMYIAVDFCNLNIKEIKTALRKLSQFVAEQDDPVVVFGNFNLTVWSKPLRKFITDNNLKVKNALFDNFRNLIIPPRRYILGYDNTDLRAYLMSDYLKTLPMFTRF
ncbi:MAG: hypothetical protein IJ689_06985 [Alphaproteobacteria bacterium]|nr:hypothetical protein [Alphaproteobacteria bacterium]